MRAQKQISRKRRRLEQRLKHKHRHRLMGKIKRNRLAVRLNGYDQTAVREGDFRTAFASAESDFSLNWRQ